MVAPSIPAKASRRNVCRTRSRRCTINDIQDAETGASGRSSHSTSAAEPRERVFGVIYNSVDVSGGSQARIDASPAAPRSRPDLICNQHIYTYHTKKGKNTSKFSPPSTNSSPKWEKTPASPTSGSSHRSERLISDEAPSRELMRNIWV